MARRYDHGSVVDEPRMRDRMYDDRIGTRRGALVADDDRLAHADSAAAEEERVTTYSDGWTMARGGMQMFNGLVALVMLTIEGLLAFRLGFALGGANANNGFVDFVYDATRPFVAPFEGIFAEQIEGKTVFEPETVIAMAVWLLVAVLIVAAVNILMSAPAPTQREAVRRERHAHYDRGF